MAKILVVDDDSAINELIKVNLELAAYTVITAEDGNKGYALAEKGLMEEGKSYIKNSFDIMKLLGKQEDIQKGIEEVNNKFGFDFSLRF